MIGRASRLIRRRPRGGRGGFTLVEMLVVTALLVTVVTLLMWPLISGFTFLSKGKARQESNAATRFAMDVMTRELSNAIDVLLVRDDMIVFVLPNMRTWCVPGEHWVQDANGRDYYAYYCPTHHTANVRYELIQPVTPMRNANGERVAIVYYKAYGNARNGVAAGSYLARAVVPFPADGRRLQDYLTWQKQLATVAPGTLTPTGADFSIQLLRFAPTAVNNEVLTRYWRGRQGDGSVYRGRYPLWKPGPMDYKVEGRDPDGNTVPLPLGSGNVDTRAGTVSFAQESVSSSLQAVDASDTPLGVPALLVPGPIVPGTEVVTGPDGSPFVRAAVVTDQRPVFGAEPKPGEYWISYAGPTAMVYVNSVYTANPLLVFHVSCMYQLIGNDLSIIASYQTYALLNIDLTVRKEETESGKAGGEGVLGKYQDFHISGKVKLLNVAR
jgi:type II secretory pathway pseudopilin PulG